ncbi:MAG: amino acid ABC transporter ATP-binding protein [Candidatus Borkfalkiaceae bacterium]|nr:amino acid ABC transporter ATP-binding protein [Clostridia bacterium]MDY6223697.1 amino acid ABC transporter ATP-binding protein [Christensenellaceae bacterium]
MAFLEVRDLRKSFNGTEVLKNVSFDLEKGKVLAVIGSSGNGKTTLLRCLNNLETADGGTVRVDGETVFPAEKTKEKTRAQTGLTFTLVFQNFQLFPQYTAERNVSLAADLNALSALKKEKLPFSQRKKRKMQIKEENAAAARTLLEKVGLSEKYGAYPCELSGGQQQRVAIARALALKPEILCFDEPTSALDPRLTGEISALICELKKEGRTMIVVTHEMEFARSVADEILFLHEGRAEESGSAAEAFAHPKSENFRAFVEGGKNK